MENLMSLATARRARRVLPNANAGAYARPMSSLAYASWSINQASLEALSDLGLTATQIARYFSLDATTVRELLNRPI